MRKFIGASAVVLVAFTIATAEEVTGVISKIDGNKVTFKKGGFGFGKKEDKSEEVVLTVAADAKVTKAKTSFADKKFTIESGDPYEGGLKKFGEAVAEAAEKYGKMTDEEKKGKGGKGGKGGFGGAINGLRAQIITDKDISDKDAKITEIRVLTGGKGGKGKDKKDAQ
jgi:hypothetical protein